MTQTSFGVDGAGLDSRVAEIFGIEDARRAGVMDALVAGDLDDGALGGEIALHDDEAAGGFQGSLSHSRMTGWPGVSTARAASSARVLPETVGQSAWRMTFFDQAGCEHA